MYKYQRFPHYLSSSTAHQLQQLLHQHFQLFHYQSTTQTIIMPTDAQIAGGHKANINNPNTSEESKQHSREVDP
jgi:4-alpha-glucanotransferase